MPKRVYMLQALSAVILIGVTMATGRGAQPGANAPQLTDEVPVQPQSEPSRSSPKGANDIKEARQAAHEDSALRAVLKLVQVPAGYRLIEARLESMDDVPVQVYRFAKSSGENAGLGGEHFSIVVAAGSEELKGITWMDSAVGSDALPSKQEALETAMAYFDHVAPGLRKHLQVLWVDRHDETVVIETPRGKEHVIVSGMKVKCRQRDSGKYAWVVVGPDGKVITFERDIVWNTAMSQRTTEKWLHDTWRAEKPSRAIRR